MTFWRTIMSDLTRNTVNSLTAQLPSMLYRTGASPFNSVAFAVAFMENIDRLMGSTHNWEARFLMSLEETTVNGVVYEESPDINPLQVLEEAGLIDNLLDSGVYVVGGTLDKLLGEAKRSIQLPLASEGFTRKFGYARVNVSPLFKKAIHALEETLVTVDERMVNIAKEVFEVRENDKKLHAQDYVLEGCISMNPMLAYVSEFKGDDRGRMYQAYLAGPTGSGSDLARSALDLFGVSVDYNIKKTIKILVDEMKDMGSWDNKKHFMRDVKEADTNPINFIIKNLHKVGNTKKPWSFVKFSHILVQLLNGKRPYIGVAVGLDAKCSGPQLSSLMVSDEGMAAATGFTTKDIDDAYARCLYHVREGGILSLNRSLVKKPFMSVLYGAGVVSMMDANTITEETYKALYQGADSNKEMANRADILYKAIISSFGPKLNNLRRKVRRGALDFDTNELKINSPVKYFMPDGLEVSTNEFFKSDIHGEFIGTGEAGGARVQAEDVRVECSMTSMKFKRMTFTTDTYNLADYGRVGFVNLIQATDALLARLIVANLKDLNAQHLIAIHDCFRVNIHDMDKLNQAIKNSYLELFGSETNVTSDNLPLGTDLIGLYFEGVAKVTSEEFTPERGSQFYGKDAIRRMDEVNGVSLVDLINDLGNTKYFAK